MKPLGYLLGPATVLDVRPDPGGDWLVAFCPGFPGEEQVLGRRDGTAWHIIPTDFVRRAYRYLHPRGLVRYTGRGPEGDPRWEVRT